MAHTSLVRVNQKMAQAKFLIDELHQQKNHLNELKKNALIEAAAFHLYCAYQHYLREIAEHYQLKKVGDIQSPDDLIVLFEQKNKFPVEAREIKVMLENAQSPLSQCLYFYQSLWQTPIEKKLNSEQSSDDLPTDLIKLISVDEIADLSANKFTTDEMPTDEMLAQWFEFLRELILRQRETAAEF